ncbi:reverse transcriptase domain-containing protein [Tanacetum coccineum]
MSLPLDPRSGTSLQATKTAFVRATPAGSTQTKGGIDCIPVRFLRSAVLMTERGMVQTPVYFISRALQGRLQKWSVMLGEHNITYHPRTSVKGQILADFLVEKPEENPPNTPVVATPPEPWTLFTDGSSCVDGSGTGLILTSLEGTEFTYVLRFQFTASNNEAEYEALIAGLRIAAQMGVQNVQVNVDSKLVANQVLGTYVAKEENMIKYLEKVKGLVSGFANFSISQVPRSKNKKADALRGDDRGRRGWTDMDDPDNGVPKNGTLPGDRKEASKLRIKARQYELMEGTLYKRPFLKP